MLQILSPLDQFFVYKISIAVIAGCELAVTSVSLYGLITIGCLAILGVAPYYVTYIFPVKNNTFYRVLADSVGGFVPVLLSGFYLLILCIFLQLGVSNLLGNTPFGYTSATSIPFAIGGSLTLWIWLVALNVSLSLTLFFAQFIPAGTPLLLTPILAPIETVSYSARSVSLGVRLFSNVLAGHTLLVILADFLQAGLMSSGIFAVLAAIIALIPLSCIIALEIAVSLIQSYVFAVLLVSYLEGSVS